MGNRAEKYKKRGQEKREEEELQEVTLPSGEVWLMATPPIQRFIRLGKLPDAMVAKMMAIMKSSKGDPAETGRLAAQRMTPDEMVSNLIFARDLLYYCAREPRISVEYPTPDDAIAPEDIIPEDFDFLTNWVMSGGNAGSGLETFRSE